MCPFAALSQAYNMPKMGTLFCTVLIKRVSYFNILCILISFLSAGNHSCLDLHEQRRVDEVYQVKAGYIVRKLAGESSRQTRGPWRLRNLPGSNLFIYLYIYVLKACSPVNHTGPPHGVSRVQTLHKWSTVVQICSSFSLEQNSPAYSREHLNFLV